MRVRRDEQGMAIVTSMLAMVVLTALALVAVQTSFHQGDQTAADRRRVQSVGAAEAGIDYVIKVLETTNTAALPCGTDVTGSLAPAPSVASYRVRVTYYASYPPTGVAMACPLTQATPPRGALIRSTGTTAERAQSARTMEALVRLEPIVGAFDKALLADNSLNTANSFTIEGYQGNDGNIYTNGDWNCSNSPVVNGSVYAQGRITMANSCTVQGDAWANGAVTLDHSALVGGDVTSSTAGLTVSANSGHRVNGDATVLSTVSNPAKVRGSVTTAKQSPPPPLQAFPIINFVAADWQASGYTVQTFADCAAAKTFIDGLAATTTKYVVRITSSCDLSYANNSTVNLGRDLAIVTDGSFTAQNRFTIQSTNPPGNTYSLFLIVPYTKADGGAQTCTPTGTGNINLTNQTTFSRLNVAFYTPCTANVANLSRVSGQVIARTINVANNFLLRFSPVLIPNAGYITGSKIDVAYLREVRG